MKGMIQNSGASLKEKVKELERAEIISALEKTQGVKAKAARLLGITERMIGYKIRKYEIDKEVEGYLEGAAVKEEHRKSYEH